MRTMTTIKQAGLAAMFGLLLAMPAMAQSGPGWGGGCGGPGMMGGGPGMMGGGCGGPGMMGGGPGMMGGGPGMMGGGPGYGRGMGMRGGASYLSPEEISAFRQRMWSVKSYDECKSVQSDQHALIVMRAKEKGVTLPDAPQGYACDRMRARGYFK